MVYSWETYREICRRRYINEGWTLDEIMAYLKKKYAFNPCRRAFQEQFKRWNFPHKMKSRAQDAKLLKRTRELWQQNLTQLDITRALKVEGFQVTERDVEKLRHDHRLFIRGPNRDRSNSSQSGGSQSSPWMESDAAFSPLNELEDEAMSPPQVSSLLPPDLWNSDSAERGLAKRRNRFKRDDSGAKVPFPSDMTLGKARGILRLDDNKYEKLGDTFKNICTTFGIITKWAEPEKWETAKNQLRASLPFLCKELLESASDLEEKIQALDIICKNVTKTMRLTDSRMTQKEAKNALGLDPQQAREVREVLTNLLKEAGYANKPDAPPTTEQWIVLKGDWGSHCPAIRKALDDIGNDVGDDVPKKKKALEVLSRDILKRLRDDRRARHCKKKPLEPDTLRSSHHDVEDVEMQSYLDGPVVRGRNFPNFPNWTDTEVTLPTNALGSLPESPYTPRTVPSPDSGAITPYQPTGLSLGTQGFTMQPQQVHAENPQQIFGPTMASNGHLYVEAGHSLHIPDAFAGFLDEPRYVTQTYGHVPLPAQMLHYEPPPSRGVEAFYHIHESSTIVAPKSWWMTRASPKTMQELRQAIHNEIGDMPIQRIEGVNAHTNERWHLDSDEALLRYFTHVDVPSFLFLLAYGWQ
ncbi:hypothetical protein V8C42DRAFT_329659 [Trichoderma barbatum]